MQFVVATQSQILYSIFIILILFSLTIFQLALIFKKPFGEYAWGGYHKILPNNLRIASCFSILIYVFIAITVLSKTQIINWIGQGIFLNNTMVFFTIYFLLGIPLNYLSRSKKERLTMTPIVTVLAVLSYLITF